MRQSKYILKSRAFLRHKNCAFRGITAQYEGWTSHERYEKLSDAILGKVRLSRSRHPQDQIEIFYKSKKVPKVFNGRVQQAERWVEIEEWERLFGEDGKNKEKRG